MASVQLAACSQVTISGTSAQSAALPCASEFWLMSTVDCFVTAGADPTATATGAARLPLLANTYVPVQLPSVGSTAGVKIAAITTGASGTLYIIPLG